MSDGVLTAAEAVSRVRESAERIKNDAPQRFPEAATEGDYVRQGDVYIWAIDEIPEDAVPTTVVTLQLAPGNTKGSRHILDSDAGVTMYQPAENDELHGPLLALTKERTVTHPEHGDWILPPGCYAITYQRDNAEIRRRRAD